MAEPTSAAAATVSLSFPHSPSPLLAVGEGGFWRVLLLCTFGFVDYCGQGIWICRLSLFWPPPLFLRQHSTGVRSRSSSARSGSAKKKGR